MDREIRRLRTNLYTSGVAFIGFGVWTIAKVWIYIILLYMDTEKEKYAEFADFYWLIIVVICLTLAVLSVVPILIHLYIGMTAMRVAKKKKESSKRLYLVLVVIYVAASIFSDFWAIFGDGQTEEYEVSALFVDLTVILVAVTMVRCALKLAKLDREAEPAAAA